MAASTKEFVESSKAIANLIDICGGNKNEAARRLGVPASTFSHSIRAGRIPAVYDIAARAVLAEAQAEADAYFITVLIRDSSKMVVVTKFLEALAIDHEVRTI